MYNISYYRYIDKRIFVFFSQARLYYRMAISMEDLTIS